MSQFQGVFRKDKPQRLASSDFATVVGVTIEGVRLRLDGEEEAGEKFYNRLESYDAPAIGDRVYIIRSAGSILVVGKVAI